MNKSLFFIALLCATSACENSNDPDPTTETGDETGESANTTIVGADTTTETGEDTGTMFDGPDCVQYEDCLTDALEAMAACGAAEGPCTDPELDGCDRMACLSSCRLEAAQDAQGCDDDFVACSGEGSAEACSAECYETGVECLGELDTCEETLFGECSENQGECISQCTG